MQYILSLNNTREWEAFLTFWRPDNNGYTFYLEAAGDYSEIKKDYHDGKDAMPVTEESLKYLMEKEKKSHNGNSCTVVLNNAENLRDLGLTWIEGKLHRAIKPEFEEK